MTNEREIETATVAIPKEMAKRVNLASAAVGLSFSEYVRSACCAGLMTHAEHDPTLGAAFHYLNTFDD
jgi:hypothetical protein